MSSQDIKDKHGEDIHEGDTVGTRYRGGTREGAGIDLSAPDSTQQCFTHGWISLGTFQRVH